MTELRCYEKLWRTALHVTASAFLVATGELSDQRATLHLEAVLEATEHYQPTRPRYRRSRTPTTPRASRVSHASDAAGAGRSGITASAFKPKTVAALESELVIPPD